MVTEGLIAPEQEQALPRVTPEEPKVDAAEQAEEQPASNVDSNMIKEHLLSRIEEDFDYAMTERLDLEGDIQEWRRIFNGRFKDETKKKFPNSLFIRKAAWFVYRIVASVLTVYFERRHLVSLRASNPKGMTPLAAEIATKVLRWHMTNSINAYLLIEDAATDCCVDSTACLKMGWERKTETITNVQGEQVERTVTNKPFAEIIPLEDVFPDPDAKTQEDLRFVIHEKEVDVDYLREKGSLSHEQGGFMNVDEVIDEAGKSSRDHPGANYGFDDRTSAPGNKQRHTVRIREYWGKLQLLPDEVIAEIDKNADRIPIETLPKDVIVTTYEDKTLLRIEENPYGRIPFFFGRLLKKKGEFRKHIWGESLVELMRDLQREWNSIRNQRRRYAKRALAGRIIVGRSAGLDMRQLRKKEDGGIIFAEDVSQVKDMRMPDVARGFDMELQLIDGDFEDSTGITKGVQGMQQKGNTTATEFQGVMAMAMNRIGHMLQVFNLTFVEPMTEFLLDMIVQWETQEHVTEIIGAQVLVPPLWTIFDREMDSIVEAGIASRTTQQQIQEVQMGVQVVSPMLAYDPQTAIPVERALIKKLLDLLPLEDVEQIWEIATGTQQPAGQPLPPTEQGQPGAPGQAGEAGRGTFSAKGQPPARPPAPRPVMPGQVQGGMANASR